MALGETWQIRSRLMHGLEAICALSTINALAAIPVGPAGSGTLTFDTLPAATEWSTAVIAGDGTTANTPATLDTLMQTLTAGAIGNQLTTVVTDPTSTSTTNGCWNSTALRLTSRAGLSAATPFMATLQNTSGLTCNALKLSFTLSGNSPASEDPGLAGYALYTSLTGATGSWQRAGIFGTRGAVSTNVPLTGAWDDNALLYVLWVDDNGSTVPGPDGWWGFDDVSFTPGSTLPTSVSITSPANGATVLPTFQIQAGAAGGWGVTNVTFCADGRSIGSDTTAPYSCLWRGAAAGRHALTAVAQDIDGLAATSSVVLVRVAASLGSLGFNFTGRDAIVNDTGAEIACSNWYNVTVSGGKQNVWPGLKDDLGNGDVTMKWGRPGGSIQEWNGVLNVPIPLLNGAASEAYFGQNIQGENLGSLYPVYDLYLYGFTGKATLDVPCTNGQIQTCKGATGVVFEVGVNYCKWQGLTSDSFWITVEPTSISAFQIVKARPPEIPLTGPLLIIR